MVHDHDHGSGGLASSARRALWLALALNGGLLVAEVAGGFAFDSLALLADGAHLLTDVVAIGIALVAQQLVSRPGSDRHTYGLRRAEALGAQASAVLLLVTSVWVFVEAAQRLEAPEAVNGVGVVVLGTIGLAVNAVSAWMLARARGGHRDLNVHGAFLHMASDAAASLGAVGAGVAVIAFDANRADPIASILVGLFIVVGVWRLLRDTINVLLEGAPRGIDLPTLEAALVAAPGVTAVHHLHVWELASDLPALSVHVVLDGEPSLHDAQAHGDRLKHMLSERFGIEHATLELECHDCATPRDRDHRGTTTAR